MRHFYSFDLLAIVFSCSCLPLMFLTTLPSMNQWYFLVLLLLIITLVSLFKFRFFLTIVAVFLLGFLWSTAYAKHYLDAILPYIDKTVLVTAQVTSTNTNYQQATEIESYYVQFSILEIDDPELKISRHLPISIYWDQPTAPLAGQIWHLTLKTKVVHSYLNEGGFDSQRFAMANRTLLSAKLVAAERLNDELSLKQQIVNRALPYTELVPYRDIMLALAFGDRSQLTDENRTVMMQTGVAHLMAISGMHIVLVFFLCSLIAKCGLFLLPQRFIYYGVPIAVGWLCAVFYAWLTGFNPPALRAILALSIWIYLRYKNNQISAWQKVNRIIAILLLLISPFFKLQDYVWRLDMLDVGHGLAVVIHNGKSAILYDTGAKWEKSSAAERVIMPFLLWHNLQLEGIMISHQHNDHIGGLAELQHTYPNAWLMSSSTQLGNDFDCISGNKQSWHNLSFTVLWPDRLADYAGNEDSCVIQVSDGKFSLLLTGDLEKEQEYQLVTKYRHQLSSTVLQIPHHGSSTSSSYAFLNHVSPIISLASASRYNPWKLPSRKIMPRYHELALPYFITAQSGQISLFFNEDSWQIKTMREKIKPRWYHNWFGELPNYNEK